MRSGSSLPGPWPEGTFASLDHTFFCVHFFSFLPPSLLSVFPSFLPFFLCLFVLFRAVPTTYGGSQARGLIGAVAASLCHSHRNLGSQLCLQPTLQLRAMPDP